MRCRKARARAYAGDRRRGRARRPTAWLSAAALIVGAFCAPSVAQDDQPTLDELLELESESSQSQDEAGPATQPSDGAAPTENGQTTLEESVERMLSGEEAADAFEQAVKEMDDVSQRLGGRLDAGADTQRMQQRIIKKLDQVIAAARRQQSKNSSGGGGGGGAQQPNARQQDQGGQQVAKKQSPGNQKQGGAQAGAQQSQGSQAHSGQASPGSAQEGEATEQNMRELREEWGSLPPRLRDEISEGMNERFSPVYRSLTEAYYQQLAEEE